jgi:hypothetical protein
MSYDPGALSSSQDPSYNDHSAAEDQPGTLALIGEALLLNSGAYRVLRDDDHPFRRGIGVLFWIILGVAVAYGVALATGLLTSPRIDLIQQTLFDAISRLDWYTRQAAASPDFAANFGVLYGALWQGGRIVAGYPSISGTAGSIVTLVLGTFVSWLLYGLIAHLMGRWYGGKVRIGQFYGALALSYAPLLLSLILIFPGASIAASLIMLATFVGKFLSVRVTYDLGPGRALVVAATPYVVAALMLAALLAFGLASVAANVPYANDAIRALRFFAPF